MGHGAKYGTACGSRPAGSRPAVCWLCAEGVAMWTPASSHGTRPDRDAKRMPALPLTTNMHACTPVGAKHACLHCRWRQTCMPALPLAPSGRKAGEGELSEEVAPVGQRQLRGSARDRAHRREAELLPRRGSLRKPMQLPPSQHRNEHVLLPSPATPVRLLPSQHRNEHVLLPWQATPMRLLLLADAARCRAGHSCARCQHRPPAPSLVFRCRPSSSAPLTRHQPPSSLWAAAVMHRADGLPVLVCGRCCGSGLRRRSRRRR